MKTNGLIRIIGVKFAELCIILFVSMLLGESALRVYDHFKPLYIFYDDSYNRFRGKPFASDWEFKLNSKGFKDVEYQQQKGDRYRILGIGDSFAYGVVPYRFNYHTILEEKLNAIYNGVEIINMGIPSTSPKDYLSILAREGLDLKPDMVLLSFFVGNDFLETKLEEPKRSLSSYSHVFSLLHYLWKVKPNYIGRVHNKAGKYCDTCSYFDTKRFLEIEQDRSMIFLKGHNNHFLSLFEKTVGYITQIRDLCRKQNIDLLVLIIPDEVQINPILQKTIKKSFFLQSDSDIWSADYPNTLLAAELKKEKIDNIDLYSFFLNAGKRTRLYRPRDTHWNIAGNRLAADLIQGTIQGYIDKSK